MIQGPGSLQKRAEAGERVRLKGTEQQADGGGSIRVG